MNAVRRAIEVEMEKLAIRDVLTPEQVVEAARDPASPLHEEFEWDDTEAGHKWRLNQARTLIRSVRVTIQVQNVPVPTIAYIHDPEADGQGYRHVSQVRNDAEVAQRALAREINRVGSSAARARDIALGLGLSGQVESQLAEAIATR